MLKRTKGDALKMALANEFDILVHGCNCHNIMGAGIARQIADACPDVVLADQETVKGDKSKLGTYTIGMHGRLVVINAYTQYGFNSSGLIEDQFEYEAFQSILDKLAKRFGKWRIGLPMIGMGLAGGDATRIIPMIERFAEQVAVQGGSVTLVEYQ